MNLSNDRSSMLVPYAVRRVPRDHFATSGPSPAEPRAGDIAVARVEKIGKNTRLELADGRAATLHEGDLLAVVFGNRYATEQFEGYARRDGDSCDLLSMGGLCGLVASRHAGVAEPSKLRLVGAALDAQGRGLRLREYAIRPLAAAGRPHVTVVCGSAMEAGKTHTASSLVLGLARQGRRVAGIKLTGTAAGRDTWSLLDAGARPALDFTDGGLGSTYLCGLDELMALHRLLMTQAVAEGAGHVIIELADGLLQEETASLLRSPVFMATVNRVLFATSDPLAAMAGIGLLRDWGIEPAGISGLISMSPLAMREATTATGIRCFTAAELQAGALNEVGALPHAINARPTPAPSAIGNRVTHEQRQSA